MACAQLDAFNHGSATSEKMSASPSKLIHKEVCVKTEQGDTGADIK